MKEPQHIAHPQVSIKVCKQVLSPTPACRSFCAASGQIVLPTANLLEFRTDSCAVVSLLLSCVLDVPSNRSAFILNVEEKTLRRIRRAAGCLPSLDFSPDLLLKFFQFHNARKREKAVKKEDDDDYDDKEDNEEDNEEGKEAKGKGKEQDQEDADEILNQMNIRCKKDKNQEGLALVAVTRRITENDNWVGSTTEESFIDQHLLPFVQVIFMNDRTFVYSRSTGRIPLSDSSSSKGKDSCLALKPDFCIMYEFKGEKVGLLAIEVKLPNARSSQILSDRSKLALELKRMIDQQVVLGSRKPESFGVLVEGFECTFFSCPLHQSGCYVFSELQRLFLVKNDNDLMLIPDLVLMFMQMKRAMNDSIAQLTKKQKTEQLTSLKPMIKQTVELPQKLASSSCE